MNHFADHIPERFSRAVWLSAGLHALAGITMLLAPMLLPAGTLGSWGSNQGGDGGVQVQIVGSLSGIALPSPAVVSDSARANDSPGFYKAEDSAPPVTPDKAEPIPSRPDDTRIRRRPARTAAAVPANTKAPETTTPDNAIPYGQGGRPSVPYGEFSLGGGNAGIGVGDGAFGDKYGWYVQSMTRRISQNWLQGLVDSGVSRAPRVYLTFDVGRDGTISGVQVQQSSGIPSLDRSAQRALFASSPLPPLPGDFAGSKVTVRFWFEYAK